MRLIKRCRKEAQVFAMREHMVNLLISHASQQGSETELSYLEVSSVMEYIDTYWLNNNIILGGFIDGPFLSLQVSVFACHRFCAHFAFRITFGSSLCPSAGI